MIFQIYSFEYDVALFVKFLILFLGLLTEMLLVHSLPVKAPRQKDDWLCGTLVYTMASRLMAAGENEERMNGGGQRAPTKVLPVKP